MVMIMMIHYIKRFAKFPGTLVYPFGRGYVHCHQLYLAVKHWLSNYEVFIGD